MSQDVHVDTHIALWTYSGLKQRLEPAATWLDGRRAQVSPMVVLELQYLHEIGRSADPAALVMSSLSSEFGFQVSGVRWDEVVRVALGYSWTRDPFDRLIAASAVVDDALLVTADRGLLKHCPNAVWS